jgi:hypothetical protein
MTCDYGLHAQKSRFPRGISSVTSSLLPSNDTVPPGSRYSYKSEDIFWWGILTAVLDAKDVKKTWNLGHRLAAVSGAGLVQGDGR